MTREEHLEWCKERAREYLDNNNPQEAFNSMMSDLGKHDETKDHLGIQIGIMMIMSGQLLNDTNAVRKFIEVFN